MENQEEVVLEIKEPTEAEVNAAASKEIEESKSTPTADSSKGGVKEEVNTTQKPTGTEQSAKSGQKDQGVVRLEQLEKSYKELQGTFTRTAQERANLQKKLELIEKEHKALVEKLEEKAFDPVLFQKEFGEKGPQALDAWLNKHLEKVKGQYDTKIKELSDANDSLKQSNWDITYQFEVMKCLGDGKHYPSFAQLYPKMVELAKDEKCPVDFTQPVKDIIDALYSLAKSASSGEAVKEALKIGAENKEKEIARESNTTVAGSGRKAGYTIPDLQKMDFDKLEKAVEDQYGVADRD